MKRYLSIFTVIALLFISCGNEENKNESIDSTQLSAKNDAPFIKIGEFDSIAKNYVDMQVQVKGIVDHVCRHGGKKIFLVDDDGDIHIESNERFNDSIMGKEITVTGIVREFRVDEAYCLKMEEDNIKSHSEGKSNKEQFEQKKKHIQEYRDSMKAANADHLSYYSLEYVNLK